MSDLDRLFENAPEGAVDLREHKQAGHLRWFDKEGKAWCGENWFVSEFKKWKTIATLPQPERKTVEDAVEYIEGYCDDVWTCSLDALCYVDDVWFYDKAGINKNQVCTREEFEACVAAKAKREPEWTHRTKHSKLCKIVLEEPDTDGYIVVLTEEGEYIKHHTALKPIKPTITKAEHEFLCRFSADVSDIRIVNAVESYLAEHKVVE